MAPANPHAAAAPQKEIDSLSEAALSHLAAGDNQGLLATLRRLLELDPDHLVGLYHFGVKSDELGFHDQAIPALQRLVRLLPGVHGPIKELFVAVRALGHSLIRVGRGDEARTTVQSLGAGLPDSEPVRNWLARVHFSIAVDFQGIAQLQLAMEEYRRALSLWPNLPGALINLQNLLAQTGERSRLSDFTNTIHARDLQPFLFIACMPKSGSSFLKSALCALTGFPDYGLSYAYFQNEQELYLPFLLSAATQPTVTQQHCRATEANIQLMQGFDIRPIVLVRDLSDVVLSLYDFYDAGATQNTFFAPYWPQFSQAERIELIIDHVVPWYLAFYASWVAAERAARVELMWLRYSDMVGDKPGALAHIAKFYGLDTPPAKILSAIAAAEGDRSGTRFNKGIAGRGAKTLTEDQKARMARLGAAYRGLDLSPIGL